MNKLYSSNELERSFINNGALGIKYLLDYFETGKKDYLKVVIYNTKEIKFWLMTTMLINNYDEAIDDVPLELLSKLYNYEKIKRSNSFLTYENGQYFEYGYGISAFEKRNNQKIKVPITDYRANFKLIRNHLAHGNFIINDEGLIEFYENRIKYVIDPKWLETCIYCCLSNQNIGFRKGLSTTVILCNNRGLSTIKNSEELAIIFSNKTLETLTLTLNTSSKEKFMYYFRKFSEKTIDLQFIMDTLIRKISNKNRTHNFKSIEESQRLTSEIIKEFEEEVNVGKGMTIEKKNITTKDIKFTQFFPRFFEIDNIRQQLEILINIIVMTKDKIRYNCLSNKFLFDFLNYLEQIEPNKVLETTTPAYIEVIASYSIDFLLKTYANLLLSNINKNISSSNSALENKIRESFSTHMKINLGKLKHSLKEEKSELEKSYRDIERYGTNKQENEAYTKKIKEKQKQIESYEKGQYEFSLLSKIRNAIVHEQMEIDGNIVVLRGYEPTKKYKRFNHKKNEWYYKEDNKQVLNFELRMTLEKFIEMLTSIYTVLGIEVKVNISKYQKRMLKRT